MAVVDAELQDVDPSDMKVDFDESVAMENMQALLAVYIPRCLTAVLTTRVRSPHKAWSIQCDRKKIKYLRSMLASVGLDEVLVTH